MKSLTASPSTSSRKSKGSSTQESRPPAPTKLLLLFSEPGRQTFILCLQGAWRSSKYFVRLFSSLHDLQILWTKFSPFFFPAPHSARRRSFVRRLPTSLLHFLCLLSVSGRPLLELSCNTSSSATSSHLKTI